MACVAAPQGRAYLTAMGSGFLRLLTLLALVLMPLSMAEAPASAHPSTSASKGHCSDEQNPADTSNSGQMHCTGCTGLPAMDSPVPLAQLSPRTPMDLTLAALPAGIVPETATPPPRLA